MKESIIDFASSTKKLKHMRALIDDKLSPIKTAHELGDSPFGTEESAFKIKMQAVSPEKLNNDIDDVLTIDNFKEQHSPVKINAPTYYPMKPLEEEESFTDLIGFPMPKQKGSTMPTSNYKRVYQDQIKDLLNARVTRALVDPLIEDVKKEIGRVRETTVYKDPID
jgi:hypothetical protein